MNAGEGEAASAPVEPVAKEWRCFHCDEVFTSETAARDHFGRDETREAACCIKAGAEGSMLKALRRAEDDSAKAWQAIHDETTDAAKAHYGAAVRHREQLQATEELGYERGLRDGRAEAAPVVEGKPNDHRPHSADQAIANALEIADDCALRDYLKAWKEGAWVECAEILAEVLASSEPGRA